jgi:large subunit ribosomal protein L53
MITTYITSLRAAFNPFQATSKVPRLFLNALPAEAHKTIKISATQFPRTSAAPAILELGFKDGKTLKYSWAADALDNTATKEKKTERVSLQEIVEEVNRHARASDRKAELSG